ncbi:hypothetical protein WDW37_15655 [Bdellovibrionota bacterium FG-1]
MIPDSYCISCRKTQVQHTCGLCGESLCRGCVIFLEEEAFAFRTQVPDELKHTHYCAICFEATVQPELDEYQRIMALAREVYFFFGALRHPLPVLRRAKVPVQIADCIDRDETILRLGFLAAEAGYNGIIEAEVTGEKVRNNGYQKTRWQGIGRPAEIDTGRLERRTGVYGKKQEFSAK